MSAAQAFSDALTAYRTRSAERFALRHTTAREAHHHCTKSSPSLIPYQRTLFPALVDYLSEAAAVYRRWKLSPPVAPLAKAKTAGGVVGHGEVVESLAACVRRDKWLLARQLECHRKRAVNRLLRDVVVACGIPEDVRATCRQRFLKRGKRNWVKVTFSGKVGNKQETDIPKFDAEDRGGYAIHIARSREALRNGHQRLLGQGQVERVDTFEEVRKRYIGKPDEMYRRRTARKFARYRREKREREAEALKQSTRAEVEMKRRRGHDHLLTTRDTGDASFAPFLFELASNAYAFSSKITDAPKLRKQMINKYSKDDNTANSLDGWQKAHHAAETNPLFHTRVMNRFM